MTAAQPPAGIRNNPGNITAQAGGKPRYAGETGSWVGPTSGLTYAIFDSREMGLRAMFREFTTKLQRHKGDVELAILEYLGGGREGTIKNRIKRARRHNDDPEAYARRAQEAYDNGVKYGGNLYTGLQGLVARAVLEENLKPEHRDWYLDDPAIIAEAEKLAGIDVPANYSLDSTRTLIKFLNIPPEQGDYDPFRKPVMQYRAPGGLVETTALPAPTSMANSPYDALFANTADPVDEQPGNLSDVSASEYLISTLPWYTIQAGTASRGVGVRADPISARYLPAVSAELQPVSGGARFTTAAESDGNLGPLPCRVGISKYWEEYLNKPGSRSGDTITGGIGPLTVSRDILRSIQPGRTTQQPLTTRQRVLEAGIGPFALPGLEPWFTNPVLEASYRREDSKSPWYTGHSSQIRGGASADIGPGTLGVSGTSDSSSGSSVEGTYVISDPFDLGGILQLDGSWHRPSGDEPKGWDVGARYSLPL